MEALMRCDKCESVFDKHRVITISVKTRYKFTIPMVNKYDFCHGCAEVVLNCITNNIGAEER